MTRSEERVVVDFVVVGAQRSATTHLNACLRDHPAIFMCRDEVPFFEAPFFDSSSIDELGLALAAAMPGQLRGIQRPDYLARPECAQNIHSLAPEARIVAVLRDPVARAVSAYHWYMQFGLLPLRPLDTGIERLLDGWTDPDYPRGPDILELGFYGRHLARYLDVFGSDHVLALLNEDIMDAEALPTVYRFLGVADDHTPPRSTRKTNAGTYDLRRLRILRSRRRFIWTWDDVDVYTYRPRRLRRPIASLLAASIVGVDRFVLAQILRGEPPSLRPDLDRRMREVYAADVETLEGLIGRDLTRWRRSSAEA